MILNDKRLRELGTSIIHPFIEELISTVDLTVLDAPISITFNSSNYSVPVKTGKVISYGLSSYGYDIRVQDKFLIYHNAYASIIDPKNFDESNFVEYKDNGYCLVPPNSFVLCESMEYITVPSDCLVQVAAKSTYARCGLVVNSTVLEPGWEGTVTLELSNTTPLPIKVYSEEGIVQLIFHQSEQCETDYSMRNGKYNKQEGITLPK